MKLEGQELVELTRQLSPEWQIVDGHHLERTFRFADFALALAFTNQVGALAEQLNHHPDICLGWGRATVTTWSHDSGGLTRRDFALAAKIDGLG
jgi:4a-hydroxytetrahydrobiopterin dehydratase